MFGVLQDDDGCDSIVGNVSIASTYTTRGTNIKRGCVVVACLRVLVGMNGQIGDCIFPSFYEQICVDWQAGRVRVVFGIGCSHPPPGTLCELVATYVH